jgi:TonB family protein
MGIALAAAVAVHAIIVLGIIPPLTGDIEGPVAPPEPEAAVQAAPAPTELEASCVGDAVLAAGAEAHYTMTPFDDETLADVADHFWTDIARCRGQADDKPVSVAYLDPKQLDHLKSIDPEPLLESVTPLEQQQFEQKQQEALQKLQEEVQKMAQRPPKETQVVETVKPAVEIAPDNARYVSEYNTKVDRETVARGAVKEKMVEAPKPEELKVDPKVQDDPSTKHPPVDRPPGQDERAPDVPGPLSMRRPGPTAPSEVAQEQKVRGEQRGETAPATDGYAPQRGDGAISQEHRDPSQEPPGQTGAGGGAPRVPNLRPTDEQLQRVAGGGSVDHYDDVDDGDITAVNSRQWVGASFMNRTKRQVAQEWRPADVWRRYDPTGSVYGFKTRVTVLRVVLAQDGGLMKATVVHASGVDFLDDEAVRAFHAASPFPNPPDVLRGDDGNITFNFAFYFDIEGGHESWKIFRAN